MWAQGHSRYLGTRVQRHLSLQAYMCVGMQGKWALHKHIGMQTTLPCRRVTTQGTKAGRTRRKGSNFLKTTNMINITLIPSK